MFMGRGLAFLCKLLMASSHKRYQMFQSIMNELVFSDTQEHFITYALRAVPLAMRPGGHMVEAFCHYDKLCFEGDVNAAAPPFAWVWVNKNICEPFYAQKRMEYLRSLGYVMWDKDRLSPLSFFKHRPLPRGLPYDQAPCRSQASDEHEFQCSRPPIVLDDSELCTFAQYTPRAVSGSSKPVQLDEPSGTEAAKLDGTPQIRPVKSSSHSTLENTLKATLTGESMANSISDKLVSPEETKLNCETAPNNPQLSIDEGDDSSVRSMSDGIIDKAQAEETEVGLVAAEGPVAPMKTTRSDKGCTSIIPPSLYPQAIQGTDVAQDELAEHGDRPDHAPVIGSNPLAKTTPGVLPMEHSFNPVMPDKVNHYTESFSDVDHSIDSSSHEDYSPHQVDATTEAAAAELEGYAGPPRARKMARAISPKAKMLKSQQKFELQQIEDKADTRMPNSTELEAPIPIRCTTPGSTVIPVRAPSPAVSECSSTSSGSINWITSPPPSVKLKEQGPSADTIAMSFTNPPPQQSKPPTDADEEAVHLAKPAITINTELAAGSTDPAPYTLSPSEIATWIENRERQHSSSSSSALSGNSTPTKQQRKKANRKARDAMMELAAKQAQEAEVEAERVKVEEAKKECQKVKKERKGLEKQIGVGAGAEEKNGQIGSGGGGGADKKKKKSGKAKKERKIGYVFG